MKNTQYLVTMRTPSYAPMYPQFDAAMQLQAWVPRAQAPRFLKPAALVAAVALEQHIRKYSAVDTVEIVPASGGMPIAMTARYIREALKLQQGGGLCGNANL